MFVNSLSDNFSIELIGEEIYDEFDVEGAHGEPLPLPQKVVQSSTTLVNRSVSGVKNLNIFRSRSAPPKDRGRPGQPTAPGQIPSEANASRATNAGPTPPTVTITQPESAHVSKLAETAQTLAFTPLTSGTTQPNINPASPIPEVTFAPDVKSRSIPPSRVGTPEPSTLEAVLIERNRRKRGNATGANTGTSAVSATSNLNPAILSPIPTRPRIGLKGKFKSERIDTGISRENSQARTGGVARTIAFEGGATSDFRSDDTKISDSRIPSEKDKEGPDKE
jgi:hypothetical protein